MRSRSPHSRPWSRTLPVAVAATALLATTACGAESTGASSPAGTTLTLAILGTPNSFDPTQLAEGQQAYVWDSIYDTLLLLDNKGELRPGAAQSWAYSADARTLTLKLREGMAFSSGSPVNSAAVKATLDRIRTTPGPNQTDVSALSSVQAPDDHTVVLRLKEPDGSLLTSLAGNVGVIGDPKTITSSSAALNPVGSGPYTLDKGATVNGSVYVLKRRDDYWNKKAYPFRTLKIRVIADRTAAVNALKSGEINAGSVEAGQVGTLKGAGFGVTHVEATAAANLVLADRAGTVLKPLADVRVRKAINMAFDRDKIVKQLLQGGGRPTIQVVNPKGPAYDPALEQTYPYDPAKAKKLLAEAGYPGGFSVTMPGLVFTKPFEPTVTQSLADIGIKVEWDAVPAQQSTSALLSKKYPMFLAVDGLSTNSVEIRDNFGPTGFRNPFRSTDAELAELLDRTDATLDPEKAGKLYREINAYTVDNAWDAPVFYVGTYWVTKKGISYLGDGSSTFPTVRQFGVTD
ncbi:ABC transporter substrate-binding protein [Streptomyces sp. NBC_00199]|uniref:ABC transporter substrate-binding protein n=1 Tax=Streptomyces sp. NBC_00199 TaxID=2975678 RepID=UPI0022505724|nr:ABC transporter substrate-binding protein [Streptomyces sp. NBC_00199]MCX5262598.1 ABC transporter substrate-binding protein [Streptomyces sp. NBC_00199]